MDATVAVGRVDDEAAEVGPEPEWQNATVGRGRWPMLMLVLSLVLAAFTIGSSVLGGSGDDEDDFVEFFDAGDDSATATIDFDEWEAPADARDPFLPLELGEIEEQPIVDDDGESEADDGESTTDDDAEPTP